VSLNWLEINKVLEELSLEGAFLQNIRQISYTKLIFEMHSPGRSFNLLICLERTSLRLHEISGKSPSLSRPPRFTAYMRSRIKGARVVRAEQIGSDRIVRMDLKKGDRTDILYIRLWGGAANIILCDSDDRILDAFSRRPSRGEIPGELYRPESDGASPRKEFTVREIPDEASSFSSCLEEFYEQRESSDLLTSLKERIRKDLEYRENGLRVSLKNQEERLKEYSRGEQYREYADSLMSSLHLIQKGTKEFMTSEGEHIILDPTLTGVQNAQEYYKKAGKAARGRELREQETENLKSRLNKVSRDLALLDSINDVALLQSMVPAVSEQKKETKTTPGLTFTSGPFTILVGRSAKENEALLGQHVRGNDYWLHTRDYPGAYVFIRLPKGKTVPLTTLLDAGNLALFYSKAKESGAADLYYTQVKYLRKPKEGKKGLVLPTKEKNLYVKLDESRIQRLKNL